MPDTTITTLANEFLSDYEVAGVPASGVADVRKARGRATFARVQARIDEVELTVSAGLVGGYTTLAALNADLAHPAGTLAKVGGDGANDGVYRKSGAPAAGSWTLFEDPVIAAGEAAVAAKVDAEAAAASLVPSLFAPRLSAMGASHVARNLAGDQTGGNQNIYSRVDGPITWAAALWPYFEWDCWFDDAGSDDYSGCINGYSGQTETQIAGHLADVRGLAPEVFYYEPGGNGIDASISGADEFDAIEAICNDRRAAGCKIVLATCKPRAAWTNGSAKWTQKEALNSLIAAYCAAGNAVLADVHAVIADVDGEVQPGRLSDGTHYDALDAWDVAKSALVPAFKQVIKPLLRDGPRSTNLVSNPTLVADGGTLGTDVSGRVGDDFLASCSACSAVGALTDGEQTFVITPNGSSAEAALVLSRDFGGIAVTPGTWVRAYADVRLSDWDGWRAPQFFIEHDDGIAGAASYSAGSVIDTDGAERSLRLMTPPMLVPPGIDEVAPALRAWLDSRKAGTGTLTIERIFIGTVPDPRPLHGF